MLAGTGNFGPLVYAGAALINDEVEKRRHIVVRLDPFHSGNANVNPTEFKVGETTIEVIGRLNNGLEEESLCSLKNDESDDVYSFEYPYNGSLNTFVSSSPFIMSSREDLWNLESRLEPSWDSTHHFSPFNP